MSLESRGTRRCGAVARGARRFAEITRKPTFRATLVATFCAAALWGGSVGAPIVRGAEPVVDIVVYQDPPLTVPPTEQIFSPRLLELWLKALAREDAETRRLAAGTICVAQDRGMRELAAAIEPLRAVLRTDADPVVRRAAAHALVKLDAKDAAEDLAAAIAPGGLLMAQIVEPGLAAWDYAPIRKVWLERLADDSAARGWRLLAVQGLGAVREAQAKERLVELVKNRAAEAPLRLAAARALGNTFESDLAGLASELCAAGKAKSSFERLLAAQLLARQSDDSAKALLQTLAVDADASVATPALVRLNAIDHAAALPLAIQSLASLDAGLRAAAAPMVAVEQNAEAIAKLAPLLGDRNPALRRSIAEKFVEFGGREELRSVVFAETMSVVQRDEWRGLEQAALVLGTLDHEPAAPRLIELLKHSRGEAVIAAAWALRKLRIVETLPALLAQANRYHTMMAANGAPPHIGLAQSQLFQLFGELKYGEAESLMRRYVPKGSLDVNARMSACWALGWLLENKPDNDLAGPFAARLADVSSPLPEFFEVRLATAISLGRMKAKGELPTLRKFAELDTQLALTGAACYWSIEQITGEKPPPVPRRQIGASNWFLEPTSE